MIFGCCYAPGLLLGAEAPMYNAQQCWPFFLGSCNEACVVFADSSSTQEEAADLSAFGRAAGG